MSKIGTSERETQNRLIALFHDELKYKYLGNWADREGNSNIEVALLTAYLLRSGYTQAQINIAIDKLSKAASHPNRSLYDNNKAVYSLLRYPVSVKTEVDKNSESVRLINWAEPLKNDFALAEEVTLKGKHERRPDLVLYVNGIALAVIELKNSRLSMGDGIRQLLSNLQRIAELVKLVDIGQAAETPEKINTPGRRALYNNLNQDEDLVLQIDGAVKQKRPDGWRDNLAKEKIIQYEVFQIVKDPPEVERIFQIIKQHPEY